MEVSTYSGSLNPEEAIDWISEINKYSDIEQIEDLKWVKVCCLKIKGVCLI